ncbi:hypothetical protein SAMN04488029_3567 [Reichenbachiella faecimaris]|uniref:Uncharacterized protein n=2 Tax=Reichenbachiella faecimaris TaxID=692418 RepID=A0A1W2GNF0_REIFA|nr:hypothetical protein SAMN04488029_3567 [Reichenbachiella faecimaris]
MTNKIKLLLTLIGFLISLYQIKAENAIALCPTGGGSFCSGGSTTIGLSRIDNFFYPLLKVVVFRFDTSEVILLPTLN